MEVGRDSEARAIVFQMHDASPDQENELAEVEYAEMHDNIKAELFVRSRSLSDLWATPAMLRRTLVAVGIQVFGQFTGINGAFPQFHIEGCLKFFE